MKRLINMRFLFLFFFANFLFAAHSQSSKVTPLPTSTISRANLSILQKIEDSLQFLGNKILYDTSSAENRKQAAYQFIPKLIRALKVDNSFYYPFDSLETIAKVYAPDSTFRIFTWQLHYPKGNFRYYGIIQMRSQKLKMFPLKDLRDTLPYKTQQILGNENWYGAIYYNIVENIVDKKPVYTLFGFEASDFITRRKLLEVLTFDAQGNPKFGAPLFHFKWTDSTEHYKIIDTVNRFFTEYKWSAAVKMNYDKELEIIIFDHTAPPNKSAKGAFFAYVQDGTYEGFKWLKNHWQHIEKVFTYSIDENDNPPIPVPIFGEPKKQPVLPTEIEKPR